MAEQAATMWFLVGAVMLGQAAYMLWMALHPKAQFAKPLMPASVTGRWIYFAATLVIGLTVTTVALVHLA